MLDLSHPDLFDTLAGALDGAVFILDPDYTIRLAGAAACRALGRPSEALVGRSCFAALHGRSDPCEACLSVSDQRSRVPSNLAGGSRAFPLFAGDGRLAALVCRGPLPPTPIAPLDRSAYQSDFVATVSHELRVPLSVVKGFVEMLLAGKAGRLRPLQTEFVESIKISTDSLLRLVDEILDLARADAGQLQLERETIDLGEMVSRVEAQFRLLASEVGVVLRSSVPRRAPQVVGDRRRLEQVLVNLVANALKFTTSGGHITISARARRSDALITVADDGIGILPEQQHSIFDRFFQAPADNLRGRAGSGLGLFIAKHIVELHGGSIWVESTPQTGSRFSFTIPLPSPS